MKKYLITGGAGFIGSHLTDMLIESGHHVIVIDDFSNGKYIHPKAQTIKANVLDSEAIKPYFADIDGCFHLVGIPSVVVELDTWFDLHAVNLQASLNVFKLAIKAGQKPVVYISSCSVYGNAHALPLSEDLAAYPISAYACDKFAMEKNAFFCSKVFGLPTVGLRLFNVYGPRQNPNSLYSGVICKIIARLLQDQPPIIYGDGKQTRDFIFVKDIVQGLIHGMNIVSKEAPVVNLCTGIPTSINELSTHLSSLLDRHLANEYQTKRAYDTQDSLGCTKKMQSLGFTSQYNLQKGLQATIEAM